MQCEKIVFSGHAVRRMFEWRVGRDEVLHVVASGEVIAEYPDDRPFPSVLLLATVEGRVLHAVVGEDAGTRTCYIVTVYPPDPTMWSPDFRTKKPA